MPRNIMLYPGLNRDAALPFGALQQAFGCISVCLSNRVNNIETISPAPSIPPIEAAYAQRESKS